METLTKSSSTSMGRKISKIRELRNMKQEALASELGVTQQAVSKMEQSEVVEEEMLVKVASILGITTEGIKHFTEEAVFNNLNSPYNNSISISFNPIEKIIELYERLLKSENEKVELLKASKA